MLKNSDTIYTLRCNFLLSCLCARISCQSYEKKIGGGKNNEVFVLVVILCEDTDGVVVSPPTERGAHLGFNIWWCTICEKRVHFFI
jgi:hypothetical protein